MYSEWASGIFWFYLLVYHFPMVCFHCENKASYDGHACSREKIEFPLPNNVLWQHVNARLHSLPLLFCYHLFVINKQYQFTPWFSLLVTRDVRHMSPLPSRSLTFFIEASLHLLVIISRNVKCRMLTWPPAPQPDNNRKTQWIQRAEHWFHTDDYDLFQYKVLHWLPDMNQLINSLKPWESFSISLTVKPLHTTWTFTWLLLSLLSE